MGQFVYLGHDFERRESLTPTSDSPPSCVKMFIASTCQQISWKNFIILAMTSPKETFLRCRLSKRQP